MPGQLVQFPRWRHRPFVEKHAANFADMKSSTAEKYLAGQLRVQRETMERRGFSAEQVTSEIGALGAAIRSAARSYQPSSGEGSR